jgi:hypothetical protein
MLKTEFEGRDDSALVFESARGGGFLTLGQARRTFQKATAAVDLCAGVRHARSAPYVCITGD